MHSCVSIPPTDSYIFGWNYKFEIIGTQISNNCSSLNIRSLLHFSKIQKAFRGRTRLLYWQTGKFHPTDSTILPLALAVQSITLLNLEQQQLLAYLEIISLFAQPKLKFGKAYKDWDELKEEVDIWTWKRLQRNVVVAQVRAQSTIQFLLKVVKGKILMSPRI